MKRFFALLILGLLPLAALADGWVTPTIAFPTNVTIPDQRALICFSNGVERLVVETRFAGAGTNFAWVVPLPNKPVIEEATTGVFPTLQSMFQPRLVHNVPAYFSWVLCLIVLIVLGRLAIKSVVNAFKVALLLLLMLFIVFLLNPALSKARGSSSISANKVSILERKMVGVFDTSVITSRDAKALQSWLAENGFVVPTNAQPVIEAYLKDGWVFAATKVSRASSTGETNSLHPLSFVFETKQSVYPMRLTGLGNAPLSVELYYFGPDSVTARHFKVESRLQANIAHPLLHRWIPDASIGTKLTASLSPEQMSEDVWLKHSPIGRTHAPVIYSNHGAFFTALNWGLLIFVLGAFIILASARTCKIKPWRLIGLEALTSAAIIAIIYLLLPKTEITLIPGSPRNNARQQQLTIFMLLEDTQPKSLAEAQSVVRSAILDPNHVGYDYYHNMWDNQWMGSQIHEEDSPGNYIIRTNGLGRLELVTFDGNAKEVVDTLDLPPIASAPL